MSVGSWMLLISRKPVRWRAGRGAGASQGLGLDAADDVASHVSDFPNSSKVSRSAVHQAQAKFREEFSLATRLIKPGLAPVAMSRAKMVTSAGFSAGVFNEIANRHFTISPNGESSETGWRAIRAMLRCAKPRQGGVARSEITRRRLAAQFLGTVFRRRQVFVIISTMWTGRRIVRDCPTSAAGERCVSTRRHRWEFVAAPDTSNFSTPSLPDIAFRD